jgi:hypothetical protein
MVGAVSITKAISFMVEKNILNKTHEWCDYDIKYNGIV